LRRAPIEDESPPTSENVEAVGHGLFPVGDVEQDHVGDHGIESVSVNRAEARQVALEVSDTERPGLLGATGVVDKPTGRLDPGHGRTPSCHQPAQVTLATASVQDSLAAERPQHPEDGGVE
jgi:hypothetical protein